MQLKGLQGGTVTNVRAVLLEGLWVQHTPWEKGYGGKGMECYRPTQYAVQPANIK